MKVKKILIAFICPLLLFSIYSYRVFLNAWACDDIMITMRAVLNFVNGYGPVSNVGERVQPFTHPLWFFLLSFTYFLTKNWYLTPFYLSIIISLLTFILFIIYNRNNLFSLIIGSVTLICSKSYINFSTSGLEAPLSHLLLLLLVIIGENIRNSLYKSDKRKLGLFFLIFSLIFLTRQDLILLTFPYILYISKTSNIKIKTIILTFLTYSVPASLWELFSLYYYGFPFPNTYYAKQYTGIPLEIYIRQGLNYITSFLLFDPFAMFMLILSLFLFFYKKNFLAINIGIILYVCYIIYVGGDFMAGRFFTPVLFFSVLKFRYLIFKNYIEPSIFTTLIIISGILSITMEKRGFYTLPGHYWYKGIADEQGEYYQNRNLKAAIRETKNSATLNWDFKKATNIEMERGSGAITALTLGPNIYILDVYALNQPLLARIPASDNIRFRPGHVERRIPTGYIESIREEKNIIQNKEIHDFYNHLYRVTSGKLNSLERFKSILYLNFIKKSVSKDVLTQEDY